MKLIEKLGARLHKSGKYYVSYGLFLCDPCGAVIERKLCAGKNANSCGCQQGPERKHGMSGTALYATWNHMRQRCENLNVSNYHRYGGRGISVCGEWSDFESFMSWALANGYEQGLEIDRINNDGDYEPDNCRFVKKVINTRNSSKAKLTEGLVAQIKGHFAKTKDKYADIGQLFGVSPTTIWRIVNGLSWR
ncbi:MAG: transposase family protein [Deltaproteobacteria bacterium]|nr:transposase family protein [Deltaproteobacteria bacterium]